MRFRTVEWIPDRPPALTPGHVRILDQTRLPGEVCYLETTNLDVIWTAIKTLQVRGAPAIGVAAAMGVAAAVQHEPAANGRQLSAAVARAAARLATARPTAVNLFWALDRMRRLAAEHVAWDVPTLKERLAREAVSIAEEDAAMCRAIGEQGVMLLHGCDAVLTHCNAGALATCGIGTALAPVYVAAERGKKMRVFADETRPLLQGARLTAWELQQADIDVTLLCDNMAATIMQQRKVQAVLVGADRIAANGDTANKIGTYGLAVLAKAHQIPFYVFAPSSTIDLETPSGAAIPIEERAPEEITTCGNQRIAPTGVGVYAPAFDVTPAELIAAIVCEKGIVRPPLAPGLAQICSR